MGSAVYEYNRFCAAVIDCATEPRRAVDGRQSSTRPTDAAIIIVRRRSRADCDTAAELRCSPQTIHRATYRQRPHPISTPTSRTSC